MRSSNERASSRLAASGARAICAFALAGLAAAAGCATGQKTVSRADTSGAVDLNGGGRAKDRTTVVVDNQNLNEMTIYAYQGTQRMRLGRARATATDSANALAAAAGRLPIHAASICLTRSVSASRRSRSNLECLANGPSFRCTDVGVRRGSVPEVGPETT